MAFENTDVGLLVNIKISDGSGGSKKIKPFLVQAETPDASADFPYGIFPTKLMVLLIAAKNKLKGIKLKGVSNSEKIEDVTLTGLVFPTGTKSKYEEHLTYSTLPFVYICDNELGRSGASIALYEFPSSGNTLKSTEAVSLDRDNGNFFLRATIANLDVSDFASEKIADKEFLQLLTRYNGDFINSGVDAGNLLQQLSDASSFAKSLPFKNDVFASVLDSVANRWFKSSGETKDYNIGAGLYVTEDQGLGTAYKPLLQSLNIKSVNKAAHAEVRIALILDFLTKYGATSGSQTLGPLDEWLVDIVFASHALKNVVAPSSGTSQLGLFSSLLPCYMCLGNIESTVGGFINSINGLPVGLNATFPGVAQTALIVDTDYYDVDSAIEYRKINIYKGTAPTNANLIAEVDQVNVSEPLVSNVRLTLAMDSSITPFPLSVSNAGSELVGIGLQNQSSMLRYTLAASALQLVHTKTAQSAIDDTKVASVGGSRSGGGGATRLGLAPVHQYPA